jgi:hypothetical protein
MSVEGINSYFLCTDLFFEPKSILYLTCIFRRAARQSCAEGREAHSLFTDYVCMLACRVSFEGFIY